jgi:hypothetical protein
VPPSHCSLPVVICVDSSVRISKTRTTHETVGLVWPSTSWVRTHRLCFRTLPPAILAAKVRFSMTLACRLSPDHSTLSDLPARHIVSLIARPGQPATSQLLANLTSGSHNSGRQASVKCNLSRTIQAHDGLGWTLGPTFYVLEFRCGTRDIACDTEPPCCDWLPWAPVGGRVHRP